MHRLPLGFATALLALTALACSDDGEQNTSGAGASGGAGTGASGGAGASTATGGSGAAGGGNAGTCEAGGPEIVTFPTDDGLTLEADFYPAGTVGGPGVVLLHMTPAGNHDRDNYPPEFIAELTSRGLTVLNVDRRGAGASEGNGTDAFTGPLGALDAKGAYDFLTSHACAIDGAAMVFVGASNGTTTALDFAVLSESEAELERPAGLVFLTGGTYTESQANVEDHRSLLDALPIQFVYSTEESAWSSQFEAGAPAPWAFEEYENGDHGTLMFDAEPTSMAVVADFIAAVAAP